MKMKHLLIVCVILATGLLPNALSAKHIIGGDVTYRCQGIDTLTNVGTYTISFRMYRDCGQTGGAGFDSEPQFGIYRRFGDGSYSHFQTIQRPLLGITQKEPDKSPCFEVPPGICVEEGKYEFDIKLPVIDGDYMITYQRCCRNVTISNIVDAEDTGATFSVTITSEAQKVCNNSPVFDDFPPILICIGQPLNVSQSATDKDGDVLIYEFCSPKQGGGPFGSNENPGDATACNGIFPNPAGCPPPYDDVIFKLPNFSALKPVAGDPVVSIDNNTGLITGTPELLGQFVVGVCVKEYRDGVLLSEISRDFQFNVTECDQKVNAEIIHDAQAGPSEYLVNSCGDFKISFVNESTDPEFIDSYFWNFDIKGTPVTSSMKDVDITFPGLGEYTGFMVVNPDSPDARCKDTAYFKVNLYPEINADFNFSYDTCIAGPVTFKDNSISGAGEILFWEWDFDDGDSSFVKNPQHVYREPGDKAVKLLVTDVNQCQDSLIVDLSYVPAPPIIVVEPSSFFGCSPANIFFNNLSVPIDSTYDIFWDFGDGASSTEISPTHIYTETGKFDVSVEIISPIGCQVDRQFNNLIEVDFKPEADFKFTPDEPNSFNNTVQFTDQSTNAVKWIWEFGDVGAAFQQNPSYTFRDTGVYEVMLVAFHPSGCPDTMIQIVDVKPLNKFHLPNAFTPNADGLNDTFLGKGVLLGLRDYEMRIFNRWGEEVFVTNDPFMGWNGRMKNVGAHLPGGVYVYRVQYKDARGELVDLDGYATLVR